MQRRKKVGGILDRRFGENDPTMTPEEKALERFVKEKQRGSKKDDIFDLEDHGEDSNLTHLGQSLSFRKASHQENVQDNLGISDDGSDDFEESGRSKKRRKLSPENGQRTEVSAMEHEMQPRPFKSKKEIMNEVIAKSKLHKYERQQAKEDGDDLRAELDKGLPDLLAFMNGTPRHLASQPVEAPNGNMNPDRAALLDGKDRAQADKEYDERLRQMVFDQRSKPSERTLTEEEKLERHAQKLKELEEQRLRRMKGEEQSEDEVVDQDQSASDADEKAKQDYGLFGLGTYLPVEQKDLQLNVEDEDDFVIEDELVASASDADISEDDSVSNSGSDEAADEEEREFVEGLLSSEDANRRDLNGSREGEMLRRGNKNDGLPYTFECPQTHEQLLNITRDISINDLPTAVQRIRALYHPNLNYENKAKLGTFSAVLVDHISFLCNDKRDTPFSVLESLIRHIHSLTKSFPEEVGRAFLSHLKSIHESRSLALIPGDLIILTALGSIFPTSDHFHQVVTPAMLCIAAYLGQKLPRNLGDLATGTYLCSLCLQYQRLSKRYMPELVNYMLRALWALGPAKPRQFTGPFPNGSLPESFRFRAEFHSSSRKLRFWDIAHPEDASEEVNEELKLSLINTLVNMVGIVADFWDEKPAFHEIVEPFAICLRHLGSSICSANIGKATKVIPNRAMPS